MTRLVLLALLLALPGAARAQEAAATVQHVENGASTPPAPATPPAPRPPPAPPPPIDHTLERWIGPLVLGAGGLALVLIALVGATQVGCSVESCTEIDPVPFTLDLVGGALLIAGAVLWWLVGTGSGVGARVPGGMAGAADVI